MTRTTPLGALVKGLIAGAAGAGAQSAFFAATTAIEIAPDPMHAPFDAPEHTQHFESDPTQTVARRIVEQLAQRGPLHEDEKKRGGQIVHYSFGAGWGGLYGLARGTFPALGGPIGALGFGTLVWVGGDLTIVPVFRLGATPRETPPKNLAFGLAAHLVYGLATWGAYELLEASPWLALGGLALLSRHHRRTRGASRSASAQPAAMPARPKISAQMQ